VENQLDKTVGRSLTLLHKVLIRQAKLIDNVDCGNLPIEAYPDENLMS